MLFSGWDSVARTLVVGVAAYVALVIFLRISGKRTLSKLNAFDFVVTVALGSSLATALITKDVTFVDGALAFALLITLQFLVTWSSVRTRWLRRLVTGEPRLLVYRGRLLDDAMRRARLTEGEVLSTVRSAGIARLEDVEAVVLETDGSLSVVRRGEAGGTPTLGDVPRPDDG